MHCHFLRNRMRNILICMLLVVFHGPASAETALDLDRYEGRVVLVDFWASWCVPCRRSFPWMNEMHDKYSEAGLVIVAINLDNNAIDAAVFLDKYPPHFQIVYDTDRLIAREFGVQAMPSSFLIGRDGSVIDGHLGFKVKQQGEYEVAIVAALGDE